MKSLCFNVLQIKSNVLCEIFLTKRKLSPKIYKNPRGYYSEPEIRCIFDMPSPILQLEFLLLAIE